MNPAVPGAASRWLVRLATMTLPATLVALYGVAAGRHGCEVNTGRDAVDQFAIRREFPAVLFALAYLLFYLLLYPWISQVHGGLHRLILALFLPLCFGLAVVSTACGLLPRRAVLWLNTAVLLVSPWEMIAMTRGGIVTVREGS